MILAYLDYRRYKRRSGRYARHAIESMMGRAFLGRLPDEVVALLRPGDLIFTSPYDSLISWSIMYFTSSEVSHVAMYVGHGKISHVTLSGMVEEPIDALYEETTRLLPCRLPTNQEMQAKVPAAVKGHVGRPYGWRPVRLKLLRILSGRDVPYFRWRFFIDAAVLLAGIDLPFVLWFGHPVLLWFLALYSGLVLLNRIRWYTSPFPADSDYMKPSDLLRMWSIEGQPVFDGDALSEQRPQTGLSLLTSEEENEYT